MMTFTASYLFAVLIGGAIATMVVAAFGMTIGLFFHFLYGTGATKAELPRACVTYLPTAGCRPKTHTQIHREAGCAMLTHCEECDG